MGLDDTVHDLLGVVLQRYAFVDYLGDDPKDKRTLVEELDCSRSTVDRGIRELEALDLVEYVAGGYRLTSLGDAITSDFRDLSDTVERRLRFQPFLRWIPNDTFDLDLQLLDEAELVLPEPGNPYAMVNRHVAGVEQANSIRCLLPLLGLHAYQTLRTRVVEHGARVESVVAPEAAQTLQADSDYADFTEEMAATGRYKLYEYDGDVPYFVGLLDETVHIGVDEEGEPRALVETDHSDVRSWAEATFEEYKQQAEPMIASTESTAIQT